MEGGQSLVVISLAPRTRTWVAVEEGSLGALFRSRPLLLPYSNDKGAMDTSGCDEAAGEHLASGRKGSVFGGASVLT